ncbi:hypothetical protein M885DRAFT_500965 [Pelagophyceae sp. CCMP2097]|nr:hypothetical protein M885DRAFT_500965 [Pelagophyceae sp. CCMP2097]
MCRFVKRVTSCSDCKTFSLIVNDLSRIQIFAGTLDNPTVKKPRPEFICDSKVILFGNFISLHIMFSKNGSVLVNSLLKLTVCSIFAIFTSISFRTSLFVLITWSCTGVVALSVYDRIRPVVVASVLMPLHICDCDPFDEHTLSLASKVGMIPFSSSYLF